MISVSKKFSPAASTRTTASPGPATGSGRSLSRRSSGPPGRVHNIAFIGLPRRHNFSSAPKSAPENLYLIFDLYLVAFPAANIASRKHPTCADQARSAFLGIVLLKPAAQARQRQTDARLHRPERQTGLVGDLGVGECV